MGDFVEDQVAADRSVWKSKILPTNWQRLRRKESNVGGRCGVEHTTTVATHVHTDMIQNHTHTLPMGDMDK